MFITSATLRNFRCFERLALSFDKPVVVIEGANGSGKTSLLEALAFACHLRSFRRIAPRELVRWEQEGFAVALAGVGREHASSAAKLAPWELKVTVLPHRKSVIANGTSATSIREIFELYRVILLGEQDLELVAGPPEERRLFLDQGITLQHPAYAQTLKTFRQILRQRAALLATAHQGRIDQHAYDTWTDQLKAISVTIRAERVAYAEKLERMTEQLFAAFTPAPPPAVKLIYLVNDEERVTLADELRAKRSLVGAHLDDLAILWENRAVRRFSSRGQQKLLVILLKCAQRELLNSPCILLVDDFMTDLDNQRSAALLPLLCKPESQVLFTSPLEAVLKNKLAPYRPQEIKL